ncbi:MAG: hypothetical protein ABR562_07650 [Thermoplasmatota archaeon]
MSPNKSRLLAITFAALSVLSAAVVLTPTATAAITPQFTIDSITQPKPIQPDLGSEDVVIKWTYTINTQGAQAIGGVSTSTTLQWDPPACVGDNLGISITGSRTQSVVLQSGTAAPVNSVSGTSTFHIAATQQAPGERPIKCTFTGKVLAPSAGNGQITDSNPGPVEVNIIVKYLGLLTAEVPGGTIQEAGPQKEIRYDLKLTNLGNSLSHVKFELVSPPDAGWLALPPSPTDIGSLQQGAPTNVNTVPFQISTPHHNGWNNADTTMQLKITPESTKDQSPDTEIVIPVIARVRGNYVPGPEPMLLAAALVGAAFVARLARKTE